MPKDVPQIRVEIAWETDPLTRPADPADWDDVATIAGLRELNIRRGAKVRDTNLETGTATGVFDNAGRELDPTNADAANFPNVQPRKRIRYILEGSPERVLFTGFIEEYETAWAIESGVVTIPASDLFSIIASEALPPSVHEVVVKSLEPVAYWPMGEGAGTFADDIIGNLDGTYTLPVENSAELVPYDPRKAPKFSRPTGEENVANAMVVHPFPANPAVSISGWFKWDIAVEVVMLPTVFMLQDSDVPLTFTQSAGINTVLFSMTRATSTAQLVRLLIQDGSGYAYQQSTPFEIEFLDGQAHHIACSIDGATETVSVWFDGVRMSMEDIQNVGAVPLASVDVAGVLASVQLFAAGWGIAWDAPSNVVNSAWVGQAAYWDRVLTDAEALEIYEAGVKAWDGDTTGERLNRVLDLVGVDPLDRDIATGTQTCGPTLLNSQNATAYVRKIAATEGGPVFVNGDGEVALRERIANDPPIVEVFSDDPVGDSGVPYYPVRINYSYRRILNIAEVARETDVVQRVVNEPSKATYGPRLIQLDTLHRSPSSARSTGARLTNRLGDPLGYIDKVTLSGRDGDVPVTAAADIEIGDAADLFARPAGGGDPHEQRSVIESVAHRFTGDTKWLVDYSVIEHVTLPLFEWDNPDAGLDESVWDDL